MESDQHPRWSRRLLQLPPNFESLPSKRHRVIRRGTHTSIVQTCDSTRMSTESNLQNTGSPSTPTPTIVNGTPSTPTPTIVNGTPSTPATTMVIVPKAPIITMDRPIVNAQSLTSKPFGSLGHSLRYNFQSIPMDSSPFSYGMSNFTSQFSNTIPAAGSNAIIGLGGNTPPYTPFSFGGSHMPQMIPNIRGIHAFNPRSNPPASRWNNQPSEHYSAQVPSYTPTSLVQILTNTFSMMNPLISSDSHPEEISFTLLGNPQPGSNPSGGIFYNPQQNFPDKMMPNQPFMNQPRGGPYNLRQGYGAYQNPRWVAVSQAQSFPGSWGQMS
jgi:hypothetical protein